MGGRPRKYPESMTYMEKYGKDKDHFYDLRKRDPTPNFLYQFYIKRGHWQAMSREGMEKIINDILHPKDGERQITIEQQDETLRILDEIKTQDK